MNWLVNSTCLVRMLVECACINCGFVLSANELVPDRSMGKIFTLTFLGLFVACHVLQYITTETDQMILFIFLLCGEESLGGFDRFEFLVDIW